MKNSIQPQPDTADLLLVADLIQGHVRRLENLATWRDVLQRNFNTKAAGEHLDMTALLRKIQASRFAGTENDAGFFIVCRMAESYAESIFETDRKLNELSAKIRAIEKREGLSEFDEFDPDHPETPADWKALNAEADRRYHEVEKIMDDRFIGWLRRYGETEMAELFATDRVAFDCRREAGGSKVFGPMPDINADAMQGDTGLTEVVKGDE